MRSNCVEQTVIFGAQIFHDFGRHLYGVTGLPETFVALKDDRLLIVGEPAYDVMQAALAAAGFNRLAVTQCAAGEGKGWVKGMLIDLTV